MTETAAPPIIDLVTGPGSPFEIAERGGMRRFAKAPPDLNMLIESARAHGDKTFIVEGARRTSFTEFFALRDTLAASLDIARGEHVALCMRNRAEWMIGFAAIIRAGGVAVLVNSRGSGEELRGMVDDAEARLVLTDEERASLLMNAGYDGRILEADDFPVAGASPAPTNPAKADDPSAILFTSGTTGRVKGAVLSHENLITGLMGMQMSGMMVLHTMARQMGVPAEAIMANMPQQAVLQVYPLFHISGLGSAFLSPLVAGSKIVIMRRWDAAEAMQMIEREAITQFTAVPTMLWDVVRAADDASADLSSLRNIGTGGQALPINLLDAVREMCPQAVMGTGYGMTETAGSVAMAVGEQFIRNRASAGQVLELVEMKIEGPDGDILPTGEAGEIIVRGPMVMNGYWDRANATAEVLGEDGWLRTGDVGYLDAEGYVFIVDRKKDMVISGGENIYCAEVERVLSEMPQITEAACFGIPDDRLGELLVAIVRGDGVSQSEVIAAVGEKLARYKAPGHVAFASKPLPRNDVGKVDKVKLRGDWPQMIEENA